MTDHMNTRHNCQYQAFTLVETLIVAAAVAVLLAVLWASTRKRPARSPRIDCVNNLKQVGLSFRQWAIDNSDLYPAKVSITNGGAMEWAEAGSVFPNFMVMSNELNTPKILTCPADSRTRATTFAPAVPPGLGQIGFTNDAYVSYFVGLDADETNPQMFLTGDSNLELNRKAIPHGIVNLRTIAPITWSARRHKHQGNVGLADGSVQGYSTARLQEALAKTGDLTNRLVFP